MLLPLVTTAPLVLLITSGSTPGTSALKKITAGFTMTPTRCLVLLKMVPLAPLWCLGGDNTTNGRVIHNEIDVKERLNTYQAAFEQMRQGVSNATDFDSLKANILSALASV